jgi:hypothetical protein
MNSKINTLKDLEYFGAFTYCAEMVLKWEKLKPDNPEIKEFARSIAVVFFYVNQIQSDRMHYDNAISEYRADKNRAVLRARKSEAEVKKLTEELNKLKKLTNLNL